MTDEEEYKEALRTFRGLREKGYIAALSEDLSEDKPTIRLSIIGSRPPELDEYKSRFKATRIEDKVVQDEEYYFFGDLRPGSGMVRRNGGRTDGPGGTLTCLLESMDDPSIYLATAGHVVSNFWQSVRPDPDGNFDDLHGSIYLNRKGFPGTNSRRFLGRLWALSERPILEGEEERELEDLQANSYADVDIGIVELEGEFDLKQRTTGYGSFGEWPSRPRDVRRGQHVMKCGAEETHWTAAVVEEERRRKLWVYGPGQAVYILRNQVILRRLRKEEEDEETPPKNPPDTPFAVSGDSGTMVVDRHTKKPVGMLIAGSILEGKYVMTPITALWEFWTRRRLVLRRA